MTAIAIPKVVRPAMQTLSRLRNGLYPEAQTTTFLQEEANRIAALCLKSWNFTCPFPNVPAGASGTRQRWRTFIHTSPQCRFINCRFLALPSNNTGTPVSLVTFTEVGGGVVASCELYYGAETSADSADSISTGLARTAVLADTTSVDLDPDTDYEVNVYDVDYARTMSICLFEMAAPYDTDNGYTASGVVAGQEILDAHRQTMTSMMRTSWKRGAAPLIVWSSDLDASSPTRTSATIANLIDGVTGSPTAATAGFTLNLANRSTIRRVADGSDIPVIMRVYGKFAGAPAAAHVYLTDSAGTLVLDCEVDSNTEGWFSTGVQPLPVTNGKYDLQFAGDGVDLLTVRAVVVYQHE